MTVKNFKNSAGRQIVYTHISGKEDGPCLVYLHGLKSSRNSSKGRRLSALAQAKGWSFLAADYTAHGDSEGEPTAFRIKRCLDDVDEMLDHADVNGPIYLIGSSLGGWIAFLLAEKRSAQVRGVMTFAAGVDFLPMVWEKMIPQMARLYLKQGGVLGPSEETKGYCFTYPMFTEAEPYLLLRRQIAYNGPVILVHGDEDPVISYTNSLKIKDALDSRQVMVHLVKGGKHDLSEYPIEQMVPYLVTLGA